MTTTDFYDPSDNLTPEQTRVLDYILPRHTPVTAQEVADALGWTLMEAYNVLYSLVFRGQLEAVTGLGDSTFRIPEV